MELRRKIDFRSTKIHSIRARHSKSFWNQRPRSANFVRSRSACKLIAARVPTESDLLVKYRSSLLGETRLESNPAWIEIEIEKITIKRDAVAINGGKGIRELRPRSTALFAAIDDVSTERLRHDATRSDIDSSDRTDYVPDEIHTDDAFADRRKVRSKRSV